MRAAAELQLPHGPTPQDVDFDRPFEAALPAHVQGAGGSQLMQLGTCREFLDVRGAITGSDTDANYRVLRLQTVPCLALAVLQRARPATRSRLPSDLAGLASARLWPASVWPAPSEDERRRLARPGTTLREAGGRPAFKPVAPDALQMRGRSMELTLTLLARGDFDGDGWEDAALRWEAAAVKGSYTDARLLIVTRNATDPGLRELPLDALLTRR